MKMSIRQMRKAFLNTLLNGGIHQSVSGAFITMLFIGQNIQDRGDLSSMHQLNKANQFSLTIGANEVGPIQETRMIFLHLLKRFSKVRVSPALPNRRGVVELNEFPHQVVIEWLDLDTNAAS